MSTSECPGANMVQLTAPADIWRSFPLRKIGPALVRSKALQLEQLRYPPKSGYNLAMKTKFVLTVAVPLSLTVGVLPSYAALADYAKFKAWPEAHVSLDPPSTGSATYTEILHRATRST